jgi:hypothetical protein
VGLLRQVHRDDQYILDHCSKYLARERPDWWNPNARGSDAWRFPIVDSHADADLGQEESYRLNEVTFIYVEGEPPPDAVGALGTFGQMYDPVAFRRVLHRGEQTRLWAATIVVGKGEVHLYKLVVDGNAQVDPLNPQRVTLLNGREWSRFFTQECTQPISFARWELALLGRLTERILPFRTSEGQRFIEAFVRALDRDSRVAHAFRFDEPVGVVNYIDKLVAREERHRLVDYKLCLNQVDRVLRRWNPYVEPAQQPTETFVGLYDQMARDDVDGWDRSVYASPRFFLETLRRHTFTGAFAHPKYGGNVHAIGWSYLEERYRGEDGTTLFDWRRVMEKPLGRNEAYRG